MKTISAVFIAFMATLQPGLAIPSTYTLYGRGESIFDGATPDPCYPPLEVSGGSTTGASNSTALAKCGPSEMEGFLGFSYDISSCPAADVLATDFGHMRDFKARYVRTFGWCDTDADFLGRLSKAAHTASMGVFMTIWTEANGANTWKTRSDALVAHIQGDTEAQTVVSAVDVGFSPLLFQDMTNDELQAQITAITTPLSTYKISVSTSEIQSAIDALPKDKATALFQSPQVHTYSFPYFDEGLGATEADTPEAIVLNRTDAFMEATGRTKKLILTAVGWPTISDGECTDTTSQKAKASADDAAAFVEAMDRVGQTTKETMYGAVGWFWHTFSDKDMKGWGLFDAAGTAKYKFTPKTSF